ncbi:MULTISPECIES: hypothetical protein [Haloferax]|uniref:Uncharacterized protein n=1 Tax=Haloferax marinum TaxID=2666143 RepID=A0A6A8GB97_9EURY|nr:MULTISPECIES: hypothetical protein [Haloferax]KAB1190648.1 hypothetical protein Hfx1150_16550 [Haloferax sp. CBA1150]MRW98177.1 hypothetical protein [Haloferax marinum]
MKKPNFRNHWQKRLLVVVVAAVVLLAGAGLATAAVSGSFETSYDGWDDESDTETRGHEIQVAGTVEVTGDAAVSPRIVVRGADQTVLDQESVQVFVDGERSIQFDRSVENSRVVYHADEIPSGTTLRVQYNSYYIGGAESGEVNVGAVEVFYDTPSGDSQRNTFTATNSLENRPESVISGLESELNTGGTLTTVQEALSYAGALFVLVIVFMIGKRAVSDDGDDWD